MKKKFRRNILFYTLVFSKAFFSLFPYRVGYYFGVFLGKLANFFPSREKEKAVRNLTAILGNEKSEKEIREIIRKLFIHYGQTLAEWVLIDKIIPRIDEFVTVEGLENIDEILKEGKGVIGIIAHFGNWELMGGYLALKGYPMTAIARRVYYESYNTEFISMRERMKVQTIYRDGSIRQMLQALKQNRILAIAGDQDVEAVDGIFVDFFGRPAHTPIAPARFVEATGTFIMPAYIIRKGMKHHIVIQKAIQTQSTGNKEADIRANTQKWVKSQEDYIRQYPHLWVWNHKRWRNPQ